MEVKKKMICEDKLLPCPFCGSAKLLLRNLEMHTSQFYITCNSCGVDVSVPIFKEGHFVNNHKRLVAVWNSRCTTEQEEETRRKNQ